MKNSIFTFIAILCYFSIASRLDASDQFSEPDTFCASLQTLPPLSHLDITTLRTYVNAQIVLSYKIWSTLPAKDRASEQFIAMIIWKTLEKHGRSSAEHLADKDKIEALSIALKQSTAPDLDTISETQLIEFVAEQSPLIAEGLRRTGCPPTDFANTLK